MTKEIEVTFKGDVLSPADDFHNELGFNFNDPKEKVRVFEKLFGEDWGDVDYLENCKIRLILNEKEIPFEVVHSKALRVVRKKLKEFQVDEDIRLQLEHELVNEIELLVDSICKTPIK